jgi:hypothetical protein
MLTEEVNKCPVDDRLIFPGLETTKYRPPPRVEPATLEAVTTAAVLEEAKRKSSAPDFSVAGTGMVVNRSE